MSLTNYAEKKIIDHLLRNTSFPAVNPYLALFTSNPGETGSVESEISGGGYARQPVIFKAATDEGVTENSDVIMFPEATESWGVVTHWGIMDAPTSGNMILYGPMDEAKTVGKSDVIKFNAGNLTITID